MRHRFAGFVDLLSASAVAVVKWTFIPSSSRRARLGGSPGLMVDVVAVCGTFLLKQMEEMHCDFFLLSFLTMISVACSSKFFLLHPFLLLWDRFI